MSPVPQQPWQCSPLPRTQVVVLVIILAFVIVMAALGYAPAAALTVIPVALAAVAPRTARAVPGN